MTRQQLTDSTKSPAAHSKPWNQLRWWLIATFVSLAVLPLLIVVPLTFNQVRAQATRQATDQLEAISELKASQITKWIDNSHTALRFMLNESVVAYIEPIFDGEQSESHQSAVNALLVELIANDNATNNDLFNQLFIYDRNGMVLAGSDQRQINKIVQRQPYFAGSLERSYTQAPYYAVGSGVLTMIITEPIYSRDGTLQGVLAGELNLSLLGDLMLNMTGLSDTGETYLVSLENNYLLTPSRFEGYELNRSYTSEGIVLALQQQNGSGIYNDYRDPPVPVIGVYRWMPELQAALMAEIDQEAVNQSFFQALQLISLVTVGAALVAVGFGFFVATRISNPLIALTQTAVQITKGDLTQRAPEGSGSNEMQLLTSTFNQMAFQLQETLAGLEQRVADRTLELQQTNQAQEQLLAELQASLQEREALASTIRELSSPVLPVADGVLVMPLVGVIDSARATTLSTALLSAIDSNQARVIILDVTGVPIIDTHTARILINVAQASRLLGAQTMLVGVRPELAQTLVSLGVALPNITSVADLQSALQQAVQRSRRG